jgi:hypothetical protein
VHRRTFALDRSTEYSGDQMVDQLVAQRMGNVIVAEVAKLGTLSAVAITFEVGQEKPCLYLAYETSEHALARLNKYADDKMKELQSRHDALAAGAVQPEIDKLVSDLSAQAYLHQSLIAEHCNGLLETGYWINPASPVLYDVDPHVDSWANRAFAALGGENSEADWYAAYANITDTLWAAIDHARRTAVAWPPIAFVASFDDTGGGLSRVVVTRHAQPG